MGSTNVVIRNALIFDGDGGEPYTGDVEIRGDRIASAREPVQTGQEWIDAGGLALAPGFIDTHTHDDLELIRAPEMLAKISQGVTTVVVGNCGISAAPAVIENRFPEPMMLLGSAEQFVYQEFKGYVAAVKSAYPAVNVAGLVGHTTLRNQVLDRLDRSATHVEAAQMKDRLAEALQDGALGLSTGLAYQSAIHASTEEVVEVAQALERFGGIYATHLRSETAQIFTAIEEAAQIGRRTRSPVVVSHLKCAGVDQWGSAPRVLAQLEALELSAPLGWDCYPYAAGSSLLDLGQVDPRVTIRITWSEPHPGLAGKTLAEIAELWETGQQAAASRLQPAGAIYHSISEEDMQSILRHPKTMIGSDGLPCDPLPHPRLWGAFPRVLRRYCRELGLFPLQEAVRKMSSLPADLFRLRDRGRIRPGLFADLVLFDPKSVGDRADYLHPQRVSEGIHSVWVNGALSYRDGRSLGRSGQFLRRSPHPA